jgi:hypothetical protein
MNENQKTGILTISSVSIYIYYNKTRLVAHFFFNKHYFDSVLLVTFLLLLFLFLLHDYYLQTFISSSSKSRLIFTRHENLTNGFISQLWSFFSLFYAIYFFNVIFFILLYLYHIYIIIAIFILLLLLYYLLCYGVCIYGILYIASILLV